MKLSNKWKKRITRTMQASLAILLVSGFYFGSGKVITNAGLGLFITFLPALMEKRYDIVADPFLSLWITSAVFFHALGSFGFYGSVWWWDHLTHALSASIVAAIGYTFIRSIDIHTEKIYLPQKFMFIFILLTIMAFGVVWELFEYGLDIIADTYQVSMPLAQHGLTDTMKDMMFNTIGATITATLAHAHLTQLAQNWANRHL